MSRDRVEVGMAAMAVAYQAKCGQLTAQDVESLQAVAEQILDHDDALFRAVSSFATDYLVLSADPVATASRGTELLGAIETATRPEPVGFERRDIYG